MAANDMMSNGFDADTARYERQNRTQPAPFAPGQDPVFQQDDIFATSVTPTNSNAVGDIFSQSVNSSFGNGNDLFGSLGGMQNGLGASSNSFATPQMQPPAQPKSQEDAFFDAVKVGGKAVAKGSVFFVKDFMNAFSDVTALWWQYFGFHTFIAGLIVAVVGVISKLFGLGSGLQIAIGGCLAGACGTVILFCVSDSARKCTSQYKNENNTNQNLMEQYPAQSDFPSSGTSSLRRFNDGDSFSGEFNDDFKWDESDEDDPMAAYEDDTEETSDWGTYTEEKPEEGMSTDDALKSMQEVPRGMYTRQYLYDMFLNRLPTLKPDFAELKQIDEDSNLFLLWGERLRDAAEVAGCDVDLLPELLKLEENLFTIIVTCDRPKGFKPDAVANELVNIYAYKAGRKDTNIFAKVDTVGKECIITIFNGASAMISVKDMIMHEKSFFLDSSNAMPAVLGITQLGDVICVDFKKLESLIVTGMPRSGKSWFVQAVLTQLCAFCSPKELHVYIGDPKKGISDYKAFRLPHVKSFVSTDDGVVNMLRRLVKVEGPRRNKIIGDAECVNIWDYKEKFPDVELPIIYVVIDEVVTLASRMDKETNSEFRMLLRELISQLPACGIRAILIPHVLNNDIIEKKTSDLVPCKVSVCGDADHVEKATGAKPKDFPYKLVNKGDMAVKLLGFQGTMYIHGPALTSTNNGNNEVFEYMRRAWTKLEPDSVADSLAKEAEVEAENKSLLESLKDDSEEIEVFTNPNSEGISTFVDSVNEYL